MYGFLMKLRAESLRDLGAPLSPFNAFLFLPGARDAAAAHGAARSERAGRRDVPAGASAGASACATPGWQSSPYRPLAQTYLPRGAGAVFAFDLRGGREAGQRFIEALAALEPPGQRRRRQEPGDPSGQHDAPPAERRGAGGAGLGRGTIRLSVGLETLDDLLWDLEHGLARGAVRHHPASATAACSGGQRAHDAVDSEDAHGIASTAHIASARPTHDWSRYQDERVIRDPAHRADHRRRRAVAECAAAELLRRASTCSATAIASCR